MTLALRIFRALMVLFLILVILGLVTAGDLTLAHYPELEFIVSWIGG